jgi:hypothetical protein
VRIELVSGSFVLPDYIAFTATQTAVDPGGGEHSWGRIKNLYR